MSNSFVFSISLRVTHPLPIPGLEANSRPKLETTQISIAIKHINKLWHTHMVKTIKGIEDAQGISSHNMATSYANF
jgi:hypothetical protein